MPRLIKHPTKRGPGRRHGHCQPHGKSPAKEAAQTKRVQHREELNRSMLAHATYR